jgi:hypothetical protein
MDAVDGEVAPDSVEGIARASQVVGHPVGGGSWGFAHLGRRDIGWRGAQSLELRGYHALGPEQHQGERLDASSSDATRPHGCYGLFGAAGRADTDFEVIAGEKVWVPGACRGAVPRHGDLVALLATFRNGCHYGSPLAISSLMGSDKERLSGAWFRMNLSRADDACPWRVSSPAS